MNAFHSFRLSRAPGFRGALWLGLLGLLLPSLSAQITPEQWEKAIRGGDTNQAMEWMKAPENRRVRNSDGDLPIHLAAALGQASILNALVECGDDLNATNGAGETPLFKAAYWGHTNVLEVILPRRPNLAQRYEYRMTILHVVVKRNQIAVLRMLLQWAPPLEEEDDDGLTPRGWAQKLKNFAAEEILRKAGALESKSGMVPD